LSVKHKPKTERKKNMPILKDQSTNWNFQVDNIAAPAFEHNGVTVKPDHFLNVRRDTGEVLGVTSKRYGVVQNRELVGVSGQL
jgi:hypothetical protein